MTAKVFFYSSRAERSEALPELREATLQARFDTDFFLCWVLNEQIFSKWPVARKSSILTGKLLGLIPWTCLVEYLRNLIQALSEVTRHFVIVITYFQNHLFKLGINRITLAQKYHQTISSLQTRRRKLVVANSPLQTRHPNLTFVNSRITNSSSPTRCRQFYNKK